MATSLQKLSAGLKPPTPLPVVDGVEFRTLDWLPGYAIGSNGDVYSRKWSKWFGPGGKGRWNKLMPFENEYGYYRHRLRVNGKLVRVFTARLVLEAFVGPRPEGMEARHFPDNNRKNNNVNNLSWATHAVNHRDRITHGTSRPGSQNHLAKLKEEQIPVIRQMIAEGIPLKQIGKQFGVRPETIKKIGERVTWKHVA